MALDKQALLDLNNNLVTSNDNQDVSGDDVNTVTGQVISSSINSEDTNPQYVSSDFEFRAGVTGLPKQFYYEIVRSQSVVSQAGGALDTKQPILFGADIVSANGEIQILADGTINILKDCAIMAKFIIEFGRTSNQSAVEIFIQTEVSTDGGVSWVGTGTSVNRRIQNSATVTDLDDISPTIATAGTLFRAVWAQSSVGGDPSSPTVGVADGFLSYSEPSAALKALGINNSASATVVIYGLNGEHNG